MRSSRGSGALWGKLAAGVKRKLDSRPGIWIRELGRPLTAAETDAIHRLCWPCPAYVLAHVGKRGGPNHPLFGWWEGPTGEYSKRPLLQDVWHLALRREIRRLRHSANHANHEYIHPGKPTSIECMCNPRYVEKYEEHERHCPLKKHERAQPRGTTGKKRGS